MIPRKIFGLTVSLQPVHLWYAAPVMSIFLNCARKPLSWWGTRPNTLSCGAGSASAEVGGGGGGAWILYSIEFRKEDSVRRNWCSPRWMLYHWHKKLHCRSCCDGGKTWSGDSTHLIKRPISQWLKEIRWGWWRRYLNMSWNELTSAGATMSLQ